MDKQVGSKATSVEKGNAFCQWVLEDVFELSHNDALDAQVMSGGRDHSIDALIDDEERKKLRIIQTKYETSHKSGEWTKFLHDMNRIRDRRPIDPQVANDEAQAAIVKVIDAYDKGWDIEYYYVTSARFTDGEKQKIEQIEGYQSLFFFYDLDQIVTMLHDRQEDVPDAIKGKWFNLPSSKQKVMVFDDDTAVIAVNLIDIYRFVHQCRKNLYASNVRQYLGKNKVSHGITDTILRSSEDFWLYNNGITIVCDDFYEEGYAFQLQTPQIVNGCQTSQSIYEVFRKITPQARNAIQGRVLVRLIPTSVNTRVNLSMIVERSFS